MAIAAIVIGLGTIHMFLLVSWIGPFFIFLAGAFDVFDGEVARRTNKEGPAGAFLDSNLDRISDAILILGLVYAGLVNYLWGYVILFLCIMISYTRSRAENEGIEMRGIGFLERAERILIMFGALIIETWAYLLPMWIYGTPIMVFNPLLTSRPVSWFWFIFIIWYIGALIFTLAQRILYTLKKLKPIQKGTQQPETTN
ncbi:MAG: CDP-alcohol phosphatidyltransferase family protein [Promethearchaeota archaeon]|nr:MAG: CDP-alcohol phosphatidyltransferase family protein [Candidatus Lokiarchaeota archaeon]